MEKSQILDLGTPFNEYTDFSIQCFKSFKEFQAYSDILKDKAGDEVLGIMNREREQVDNELSKGLNLYRYGMFDKHPRTYQEALDRDTFVYTDIYEKIKRSISPKIFKALEKSSAAEAMKDEMIFNDRELGEFIFDRAAMSLQPNLYFYSRVHNIAVDETEVAYLESEGQTTYAYKPDNTPLYMAIKVTKEDESEEFFEINGEAQIEETIARVMSENIGVISVKSNVKKVYQFKEKKPRIKNAVKLFVALTYGGYTAWKNDFYTGMAATMIAEYLEGIGYSVQIEVLIGGGRCPGCASGGYRLNTPSNYGRRFVGITAKDFNESLDTSTLLYWVSDPSALYIKMLRNFNFFHWMYGDTLNFSQMFWHGIERSDIINPVGSYYKQKDFGRGNKNLLYFMVHRVANEADVISAVLDVVLTAENINLDINKRAIDNPVM